MAERLLDTEQHKMRLGVRSGDTFTTYADTDILEQVIITYGCTDGVAPGAGATFAPYCDVVINSEDIYSVSGEIARAFFVQGAVFSIQSDIGDNDAWMYLGRFKITEPPEYTEDYQISFHAESYLSSAMDSTYVNYSLIPNYNPRTMPNYKISYDQAIQTLESQFGIEVDMSQLDNYVHNIWVHIPISPDEDKLIDITAREWLAGLAFLAQANVIESINTTDNVLKLLPLHTAYNNLPTDYYTGDSYNSSYSCAEMTYAPQWIRLRVTKGTTFMYEGKKSRTYYEGFTLRDKQVNSKTVYTPTITGNNVHQYKFLFELEWVGMTFTQYFFNSIKDYKKADDPVRYMNNGQFKYVPSSWEAPGYNSDFVPGNFILLKTKYVDDYGQETIRDNYVYIMDMVLEWTGTFNTRLSASYNGDSAGVSSSITSSATASSGDGGKGGSGATDGVINGVRIQDGTIWAQKINTHTLAADEAFIGFLNANEALLGELRAEHAYIKEMWVGNMTATSIATTLMNAEYALIGQGTIRTAIVVDEAVDNATILNLVSTYINITSKSGNMTLKDNTLLIVDDRGVPRIQIGKDANGDYDYYLWDANGKLMWSASGLAEAGIKAGVIRNDMIADNAGITGDKINNRSLVSSINSEGYKLTSSLLAYDGTGQTFESRFQEVSYNLAGVAKNADGYRLVVGIDGWVRQNSSGVTVEHAYLTAKIFKDEYDEVNHELKSYDKTSEYNPQDFLWYRYSAHKEDWTEANDARTITTGTDSTYKGVPYHTFSYSNTGTSTSRLGDVSWNTLSDNGLHYPSWDNARNCYSLELDVADVCMGAVFHCKAKVGKKCMYHAIPYQATPLDYTGSVLQANLENMDNHVIGVSGMSATDAGTHTAVIALTDGYVWEDDTTADKNVSWVIEPGTTSDIPTQSGTLTYTGSELTPTWNNYDSSKLIMSGETSGTNAGTYTAIFTPTDNYTWNDGTRDPKSVDWTIGKAQGSITLSKNSVTLTASQLTDAVTFSNATGTVTVSSNDTSIATVAKSGSTLTISAVGNGTTSISVNVASSANYTEYSTTISVSAQIASENIERCDYSDVGIEDPNNYFAYKNKVYLFKAYSIYTGHTPFGVLYEWNGIRWVESNISIPDSFDEVENWMTGQFATVGVVQNKLILCYAYGLKIGGKYYSYKCKEYNENNDTWVDTSLPFYHLSADEKEDEHPGNYRLLLFEVNGQICLQMTGRTYFILGNKKCDLPYSPILSIDAMCGYNNKIFCFDSRTYYIYDIQSETFTTGYLELNNGFIAAVSNSAGTYAIKENSDNNKILIRWNGTTWNECSNAITETTRTVFGHCFYYNNHLYYRAYTSNNMYAQAMYRLDNGTWTKLP